MLKEMKFDEKPYKSKGKIPSNISGKNKKNISPII